MSFLRRLLNRSSVESFGMPLPAAVDVERRISQVNAWRDQFNPLRSLTMAQAVSWLEQAQRGEFADIQWAYSFIERRDSDLLAIVERRTGAVLQMDWDIKTVERRWKARGQAFDAILAAEQQAALRGAYDGFQNLYAAIEHLCMATFRGYAHVQFLADGKLLSDLNCLDQWHVLRDGLNGDWYWNPTAASKTARGMDASNKLNLDAYILRQCKRPVNEIALIKYLRQNLSAKDWDSFLEVYGLPGWIVIMPPNIPQGREDEYQSAAESVAEGNSGALPNGSDIKAGDQPRGTIPFEPHLRYWSEKLVLAGTGGLLTMLTAPGSGTLAGSAHQEAFDLLARSEAMRISELLQRSLDRYILNRAFPGRPRLAYFQLAANEEQDVGQVLDHCVQIQQAGGQVDWSQISEKTGYRITTAAPALPAATGFPLLRNRKDQPAQDPAAAIAAAGADQEASVREQVLQAWQEKLAALDPEGKLTQSAYLDAVEALVRQMPADLLTTDIVQSLAAPREAAMGAAVVNALQAVTQEVAS